MGNSTAKLKTYLSNNWFRLGLIILFVFIALKKDLSFRINLNAPVKIEDHREQKSKPVQQEEKKPKRETFTDLYDQEEVEPPETPSRTDQFNFSSLTAEPERAATVTAYDQLQQVDEVTIHAYLKRFAKVAVMEKKRFGIPASIILANGMLHSRAGEAAPAAEANNYFGIKCTKDWEGDKINHQGDCYRYYENAWTSFRDHSFYLTSGSFAHLTRLGSSDYRAWAGGLEKGAFSSQPDLARQLVKVIEQFGLDELDANP